MELKSHNPALAGDAFRDAAYAGQSTTMTVEGTCLKTGVLLILCTASAAISWMLLMQGSPLAIPLAIGGAIGSLVIALIACWKPTSTPITGPLYAIAEGLFLGAISALFNARFEGIVFQAVCLTFGTMFGMLICYQSGWIKVTEKFKAGMMMAISAIFFLYLANFVLSFFVPGGIPYLHEANPIGIAISGVIVVIAALSLLLDFDFIDNGARMGAPKYMEWFGAFGLMVTLAWLYLEILRLLFLIYSMTAGDD